MKGGWRVRRAQALRRERLLQDFVGFPEPAVQAGPGPGPSTSGAKTQQTCGSVQVDRVVRALEPVQEKNVRERDAPGRVPANCSSHGPLNHLDHLDHSDQASNGAAFSGPSACPPPGPHGPLPLWSDDRGWCARIGAAGPVAARRDVLREWVAAAGGWSDADAVHLPTFLRRGLALATLKAHARSLGLVVRDDADSGEVKRLLAAGQRAANPNLASDPAELMLQPGGQS